MLTISNFLNIENGNKATCIRIKKKVKVIAYIANKAPASKG
jgi:hypothetical protein